MVRALTDKPSARPARRAIQSVQAHRVALYELLEETEGLLLRKARAPSPLLLARSRQVVERIDPFLAKRLSCLGVTNRTVHDILFQAEARLIQDVHAHRVALYGVLAEIVQLLIRNVEATPVPLLARSRLLVERIDPALACSLDYPGISNRMLQIVVFRAWAQLCRRKREYSRNYVRP